MTKDEAMKLALEALETLPAGSSYKTHNAASALRQAFEQPEQQPVAWWNLKKDTVSTDPVHRHNADCVPLYLYGHPPKIWQGLTDEDIGKVAIGRVEGERMLPYSFARAIEAKLKDKNRD